MSKPLEVLLMIQGEPSGHLTKPVDPQDRSREPADEKDLASNGFDLNR